MAHKKTAKTPIAKKKTAKTIGRKRSAKKLVTKNATKKRVVKKHGVARTANEVELCDLEELVLDPNNPRLGGRVRPNATQDRILDAIVGTFGVNDVLSSLAVNGYFDAEPLVGARTDGNVVVKEGNRRLAACLILAGDKRAMRHTRLTSEFQALQESYGNAPIRGVPVLVHDSRDSLLAYLGVRHIAAAQPWDSYAKAAWVASVLDSGDFTLEDVSQMIGDQHRTVARILEGYYFVNQLIDVGQFSATQSTRPGRGSNPDFPFSWIYTALGHTAIRKWLDLADLAEGPKKVPISRKHLDRSGQLMTFLFGNRAKRRQPSIADSREISDLAKAIGDPERRRLLTKGQSVSEVEELGKPPFARAEEGLFTARESLSPILLILSQGDLDYEEADSLVDLSKQVRTLGMNVYTAVRRTALGEGEESDE